MSRKNNLEFNNQDATSDTLNNDNVNIDNEFEEITTELTEGEIEELSLSPDKNN